MPAQPPDDSAGDFTLRQLVERFAAENGLTFMPKHGRTMAGLQVLLLAAFLGHQHVFLPKTQPQLCQVTRPHSP